MAKTHQELVARLTSAYAGEFLPNGIDDSNITKFMRAFINGCWSEIDGDIADIELQAYLSTVTKGGVMDKWAETVGLRRNPGESDTAFKVRIQGAIQRLRGGTKPDDILRFVQLTLGLDPGEVTIVENDDGSGGYKAATFTAQFDPTAGTLGVGATPQEIQDAVDAVANILSTIAAAGVEGNILTTSGAEFDVDNYDEGLYGGATTI